MADAQRARTRVDMAEAYIERESSRAALGGLREGCPCGDHDNELAHAWHERQDARMALSRVLGSGEA